MKKMLIGLFAIASFSLTAAEVTLDSCTFGNSKIEFTPSQALSQLLRTEAGETTIYKVKYFTGSQAVGPKTDLALIDKKGKDLFVSFFDVDEEGFHFSNTVVTIDLKEPVSLEAPVVNFAASLNDEEVSEGFCSLLFN